MSGSFLKKLKFVSFGSAMADMAMLLLIFFMATTTTEPPKGVEVDLPVGKTAATEQDSLYVTISRSGEYFFDGKRMSLQQLGDALANRQGEKDRAVAITADRDLDYTIVSPVLEVLKAQDFLNIVFMAQPRKGEK
ncbi:MAG: hypothetical protein CVV44_14400 [Spirochaetae bacterium HGW-Spirochaetae-1]|jgi:biopolymer transport protein ExbD|nr:MAG: hypothetical protein CVV44_14400 [Spirochaetae bacterium HGW-Spirochaetae-1]